MRKVIFIAQTDETLRKEALATLDEIMEEIRERAAQLLEVMKEDVLTCLSDTHHQLALELAEAEAVVPEEYEYELWGAVSGAPGGRWSVMQVNPQAVWPDGVALYVRRIKE